MAKVKFSALISEMRNKLNGSVFSRNRAGNYLRNKVTPVNPQTAFQTAVRALLTDASQSWRELTQAFRDAWYSATSNFTGTDIFADVRTPSGSNLYAKLFINASNVGDTPLSQPPAVISSPGIVENGLIFNTGISVLTFTDIAMAIPANTALLVRASAGMSAGRRFVKGRSRILIYYYTGADLDTNIWAQYVAHFGAPIVGERVAFELSYTSRLNYVQGPKTTGSIIVA
jgi:hypothetical protein